MHDCNLVITSLKIQTVVFAFLLAVLQIVVLDNLSWNKDLTPTSGNVTFREGEYRLLLQLTVNDDNVPENDEKFQVKYVFEN